MSHRKFEAPRHGHIGFLPRKRCRRFRGRIKTFPKDDSSKPTHLTAFLGYKAGMTHIVREVARPGAKMNKKEVVEPVTIIETPPMVVVGLVGYKQTFSGMRTFATVWGPKLSEDARRRFYKNWYKSKKKAFTKHTANYQSANKQKRREKTLEAIKRRCTALRVIAHTQVRKVKIGMKKAHIMEIQVNGGSMEDKVNFATGLFEKSVPVDHVFEQNEVVDTVAVTKGKGFKGVISRWGVTRLPRKTHRGLRKVACVGAWHPANMQYSVPRAGQKGFHHRTERHKKIYKIGKSRLTAEGENNGSTDYDITKKNINPMGGFLNYGYVNEDYIMFKGTITGSTRRPISLRKALNPPTNREALEKVDLKWIDTSSKRGTGRFQTSAEKSKFLGTLKKDLIKEARAAKKQKQ
eukprot:gb/GECH01011269.1/.p1 GENE.gb/GECH01011269.1/~~gb/GECH01011269.1/.p1  ORF type:complete len:406 (+),score=77.03 gb/GECH01011269.1/:1-1218(+)